MEIPNVDTKHIDNEQFLCLFLKCQKVKKSKIFQDSNFVIVESLMFGKVSFRNLMRLFSNMFVIFVHSITNNISTIKFLANLSFFGKLLLCLVNHL